MGPTGHSAERHVRKRNTLLQISQKDLDIVTKAANCCLSKARPLESSNDSGISAPKHIYILLSGTLVRCAPTPRSLSPIDTGPNPWDQIWDNGLSPPHGSCCRAARSAILNARAWLSRPVF